MKNVLVLVSLFLVMAGNAAAETRYISDRLEITMRSGKGTKYGITRMLRSGTPVEVLDIDKASGYSQIRTKSGKEGRAARDQLTTAEKNLAELELANNKMIANIKTLTQEKKLLEASLSDLDGESRNVSQELAEIKRTASSALALDSENKNLKGRVVSLEREMQTLNQENESLKDRTARDAAVILLGIITGLIIPRIRFRKKSSWDQF
ncbi:MAG: TIGR04211 family SH3 domain-containing protein [Deltaproteobacteria bacterium]|nr:TIGR04211 family SH3 domain-containing protein [Deltaproteobacteria bacterium]